MPHSGTFRVHYRRIKSRLFWDGTSSGICCSLKCVPLDRDKGTPNSSNTDVLEKVNFLVAASQHFGGGRIHIARGQKWPCFGHVLSGGSFLWVFSKTKL